MFYVSLKVGQREFIGEGNTRQAARHNAAAKALKILNTLPLPNDDLKPKLAATADVEEEEEEEEEDEKAQPYVHSDGNCGKIIIIIIIIKCSLIENINSRNGVQACYGGL